MREGRVSRQSRRRGGFAAVTLCALGLVSIAHDAGAQQVGTAAAVNPAAQARGSGGARTIVMGQSIAHRERIQTTSAGSVQLLFLDKTSMTIGPNSDLAIDEYVYDPATNSGKLAATLSKGVMRFVGGQISHAGNAQVTTPTAVVGIRGGVGIFQTNSVFIGYGQGSVRSGTSNLVLSAGDFIQTFGGNTPPTNPGPPPANFLQTVLATLQSQAGQGGGARASAGQVNQARTAASGTSTGTIATNVQTLTQPVNTTTQTAAVTNINQTVQTTVNQTNVSTVSTESLQPVHLTGYTAGLTWVSSDSMQPFNTFLFGEAEYRSEPARSRTQVTFSFGNGVIQFGSLDPNQPASSGTINGFEDLSGTATALFPAITASGTPVSNSNNGVPLAQQDGILVEFKRGAAITNSARTVLGGTSFCDCEYTRWGFWTANFRHGIPGNLRESIDGFWVTGQVPEIDQVPTTGSAVYTGHAVAQIRNGQQDYARSAPFQHTVNFGSRTGSFAITNLDGATYNGTTQFSSSDPRHFSGYGSSSQERTAILFGNFFRGRSGPTGEMGGGLALYGGSNYAGGGIFIAKTP